MIIVDCNQGEPEWYALRAGIPTASSFGLIVTANGSLSKSRSKYMYQLAGEAITGIPYKGFSNTDMTRGHEMEAEARMYYELTNNVSVATVGFAFRDETRRYGASPDGLVDACGGLEIKSAAPHVQAERLASGWSGSDHHRQVMGCLLVTGRDWWDLMSYCRGMDPIVIRFHRDEYFLDILDHALHAFCDDLDLLIERIK